MTDVSEAAHVVPIAAEYILPLRWSSDEGLEELTAYLRRLREWVDVTVVDGSDPDCFAAHAHAWRGLVRHVPVTVAAGANGKVRGVLTGVGMARHEAIVIADDDVRYDRESLETVVAELAVADLVKPQNHFAPLPWHARWDTARTLLNRGLGSDYPGTYGVRRTTIEATGGYDADVLFENLELERTVRAAGGRVMSRRDILVARRPPSARHFLSQRVRQAYDSFAQPWRLALEAAILPILFCLRRRPGALLALAAVLMAVAERGRRRDGGRAVFPASSVVWVPLWLVERGTASWIAILLRLRGGVRYGGRRLAVAAHSVRGIRRRLAAEARPTSRPVEDGHDRDDELR
ncbi:glycosyltransferase family 2 protein [Microbacterium oryzae]|uniref:glycosyltransferase n=1 Tax=Microbacterium oryzae TaxID=743009 RepID=UPI0025B15781|nr:glycosyltransferase family 2 protein [Microbacterium oryzae]MDN3309421.1 glycosyltransferase family 2 protein [Microbacterium oryzae]